jgi:LytS/YehU family sensor histidine kinase
LEFVQRCLIIERARYGDRLRVVREVDPRSLRVPVPGLILQPLVENAVGHGIAPLREGGTVRIAARLQDGELCVEVSDDGRGLPQGVADPVRDGHGLDNVRQRLQTIYGGSGRLELERGALGRGTVARIRIPVPVDQAKADETEAPRAMVQAPAPAGQR